MYARLSLDPAWYQAVRLRERYYILGLLVLLATLWAACAQPGPTITPTSSMEARGLVTDVQGNSLTIRDETGKLWTFSTRGLTGITHSHLEEHQALALPVTVHYRGEISDGLLAITVTD